MYNGRNKVPPGHVPFVLRPAAYNICMNYEAAVVCCTREIRSSSIITKPYETCDDDDDNNQYIIP